MPTVGRTLATERLRQGLDLDDVERVTRIPQRALHHIETDDFDQLPGLVFARNFVRQYAQFLRIDSTAIVEQFNSEQTLPEPQFVMPESRFKVPKMGGPNLSNSSENNAFSAFAVFVLTIAACAGIYYAYQYIRSRGAEHAAAPALEKKPAAQANVKKEPPKPSATPQAAAQSPPPVTAVPASAPVAPPTLPVQSAQSLDSPLVTGSSPARVRVKITAVESCWTRIAADGKVLFADVLKAGDTREIRASGNVNIRVGNAGGVSLQLNGTEVPPLGPKGQIRTVVLTPAGAQVIAPTPVPVLPAAPPA